MDITNDHMPVVDRAIYQSKFINELYPDAVMGLPLSTPKKRSAIQISCFVGADYGAEKITRKLRTRIFIFLNKALIMWYLKRENTVEASTFGSDFVAIKRSV